MKKEFKADYRERKNTEQLCKGCVRCREDWRNPGHYRCSSLYGPKDIQPGRRACSEYWDREEEVRKEREKEERRERERKQAWEKNFNNPPKPCVWDDMFDGCTDTVRKGVIPTCPNCHEMLYETDRCYFCGQAIEQDEKLSKYAEPPKVEHMDCFSCGAKDGVEFVRSKVNGHKHGHCTVCGMSFME